MGNRAVLVFEHNQSDNAPAIYLHWNGGRSSVEAFLHAANTLKISGPDSGNMDKLANMIARYFFDCEVGTTVYRDQYGKTDKDNWDNGVYVINEHFEIVGRKFVRNEEQIDREQFKEIIITILENYGKARDALLENSKTEG